MKGYFLVFLALIYGTMIPKLVFASSEITYSPKVIVLTAFPPEWKAWSTKRVYRYKSIPVKGLIHPMICSKDDVCVIETGEGELNAALSIASLLKDPQLNVMKTIFIRSGIAGGIDRSGSPLGSVYINNWVISWAFGHHYLSNQKTLSWMPPGCANYARNYYHPTACKKYDQNSLENLAYQINPKLLSIAESAARSVRLKNDPTAIGLDDKFHLQKSPKVLVGATITGDDFWIGKQNQKIAEKIVSLYTNDTGSYTNTAMEDLGDIAALTRFGLGGHYLSIRGISDIDVPPPGETQEEILKKGDLYAGRLAEQNAVIVTQAVIHKLLSVKD